jgi:hypothetical protein
MSVFPSTVILKISKHLDGSSLFACAGVARHWRQALLSVRSLQYHCKKIFTHDELSIRIVVVFQLQRLVSFLNFDSDALSNYLLICLLADRIKSDPLSFPYPSTAPWVPREWPARMANCWYYFYFFIIFH